MSTASTIKADTNCVLALDLGSSSVRALAFDRLGRELPVAPARRALAMTHTPDGRAVMNAGAVLSATWDCVDEFLERLPGQVTAVAMCTFAHSLMGLDRDGAPLTPLSTYADTSSADQASELKDILDERAVHQRVGARFHPGYMPSKLLRLSRKDPELADRVSRWVTVGEFLALNLFGQAKISPSAAAWSGAMDRREMIWDKALLEACGVDGDKLPDIDASDHASQSGLSQEFARRWPRLADVPWFPAIGDGAAANIGCGCLDRTTATVSIGTSSAVRTVVPDSEGLSIPLPFGLFCYRVDRSRLLPGGAMSEGGNIYAWLRSLLGLDGFSGLDQSLSRIGPDSHGLTVLPMAAGERSPGWRGGARATIHGMSLSTTGADIMRAGLEAITLRIAMVYDELKAFLAPGHRILAGGGALRASALWPGMLADVLGAEVVLPEIHEPSARGAALLAWEALGQADLERVAPLPGKHFSPHPGRHAAYRAALERHKKLDSLLAGTIKKGQ